MKTHISPSLARIVGPATLGLTLFAASQTHAVISSGLTAYWSLDNTLNDAAGTYPLANSTTADNGSFTAATATYDTGGRFGQAFKGIGGNNGKITVPLSGDLSGIPTGSVTVSVWFKAVSPIPDWGALVAVGEGSAWRIARNGNSNPLKYSYAGGSGDITTAATFGASGTPITTWTHLVAVTEKNVGTRLYINGVQDGNNNAIPNLTTNNSTVLWIGGNPNSANRTWNGLLDDIGIWNRALTQAEITQLFTQGNAATPRSLGSLLAEENLDTDGDGLVDAWEQAYLPAGAYLDNGSTNPDYGANGNPDDDASTNLQEFQRHTLPLVADTDGDGLKDGYETNTGIFVSATNTGTNPLIADMDGDGLKDGVENPLIPFNPASPLTEPGSSPFTSDGDSDGFPDGVEAANGTNPTSAASMPTIPGLPITDNFNDGIFDTTRWGRKLNVQPGGAAVTETGTQIELTGRGHLNTASQFNPDTVGGLYITGKWTFKTDEDFLQILTRTDGEPQGQYGETATGLEFYLEQTSNTPTIRGRTSDIAPGAITRVGKLTVIRNKTYNFTVIDGGTDYGNFASIRLTQADDPFNSVTVYTTLASATATANYVSFHNREGGNHVSALDDISIKAATDADGDDLPDAWESDNGLNPQVANTGDTDADGSLDIDEYLRGTKPTVKDSDGDGVWDGPETGTGGFTDATDTGSDPLIPDTDGDLLSDGVETGTGTYVDATHTGSNPTVVDSDGDGIADGVEVSVGMNPSDPDDKDLKKGLVSYWTFDNTLADVAHGSGVGVSGTADNGSFTGAPDVAYDAAGRFGPGILLNGGAGWVTVPKSQDTIGGQITHSVSVSMWVKVTAFSSDFQTLIAQGEGTHWRIARNGSGSFFAYAGGSNDINSTTSFTPPSDWVHVVAVSSEGVGTKIFINGAQENTGGEPNLDLNLANASNLFIGANPDSSNREWSGYIDDVAIWNRPLKLEEVEQIYQAGSGTTSLGGLVGIVATNTYANWISGYNVGTKTGFEDDFDGDGLENGVENLLGTNPSVPNKALVVASSNATVTTFRHPANASPASDISASYQWSTDMSSWNNSGVAVGGTTVTFVPTPDSPAPGTTTVTATVTGTGRTKLFFRLVATQG
ncbi:LamG-like jellyroll fold domain-containing protein [Haloferula sp. BvORR071]|uniref:LamG-like jellyroll fold domain-containing protein n=1 Tax=Haloferula sp. BvORR071 TaxID=1396141 RepID=UPI000558B914|nr:LamG-like jellyroll fold domain-containing protein [Haloferula sp. BvORR071]